MRKIQNYRREVTNQRNKINRILKRLNMIEKLQNKIDAIETELKLKPKIYKEEGFTDEQIFSLMESKKKEIETLDNEQNELSLSVHRLTTDFTYTTD